MAGQKGNCMIFTKRKDDTSTIRKVWCDDRSRCYGLVGKVGDLVDSGIMDYCEADRACWCFIPVLDDRSPGEARFGETRDKVVEGCA